MSRKVIDKDVPETESLDIVITCDNPSCKKEKTVRRGRYTPVKWLRLEKLKLLYRANADKGKILNHHILSFDESADPDFCSEKCLMAWLKKEISKIKKNK